MNVEIKKISTAALQALNEAEKEGIAIGLTVTDQGGHVVYQIRMDDANFMANEVSYRKAKTAYLFKCPTHVLKNITDQVPVLLHAIQQVPGDAIMLEGGLPLQLNGRTIGGVGVSGGNFEQDLKIATSFVDGLKALMD